MKKRFFLFILLIFIVFSFSLLWWQQAISPANSKDRSFKIFVIKRGEDTRTIAKNLQAEGLIRDPIAFFLLVRFGGLKQEIQSGDFRLSPSLNMKTVANTLTHGTLDTWVTTLEGWRNEEIATKLSQDLGIPESEFLKVAREGYMFPDTYLIPKDSSPSAIASMFINNFNKHVTSDLITRSKQRGYSLDDLIIIASLVEREAKYDADRPIVASVIMNRLKMGMKLDVDATVQYALGYQTDQKSWWKKELFEDDLKVKSPYNTYINNGLPPAPIDNPGLASILAVLNAPETNYIYYVSDKQGRIHAEKSIEEHNLDIQKYLNQ